MATYLCIMESYTPSMRIEHTVKARDNFHAAKIASKLWEGFVCDLVLPVPSIQRLRTFAKTLGYRVVNVAMFRFVVRTADNNVTIYESGEAKRHSLWLWGAWQALRLVENASL